MISEEEPLKVIVGHRELWGRLGGVQLQQRENPQTPWKAALGSNPSLAKHLSQGALGRSPKEAKDGISLDDPGKGQKTVKSQTKSSSSLGEKTMEILSWGECRSGRGALKAWSALEGH